ncbi:cell wall protein [Kibdelosporangium philippinense]|uniref:Cell wall protein n=1 Tax=Kibdelosporangium philippinense TaxID=211113 RepID=A0ABS8ZJ44_9PSEU|nr:cell wall protein [Kibdelosporangium philippinense]MCE7007577.1 cell wall protein [Kibdelosporangium philippinense]
MESRRKFLTAAVLTGATAFGSLAPETAFAEQLRLDPDAVDPDFAEGRITGIQGTILMVTGSDKTFHRIQITSGTSIWKLRNTTLDDAKLGDGLYARGARMPDGVLAADSIWLNIVNLRTHIVAINRNVLHLDHHGHRIVGHVVAGTTAAVYNGTPAISDLSLLQVGKHAQVIGAWRPDTNDVDIATVYAAAA